MKLNHSLVISSCSFYFFSKITSWCENAVAFCLVFCFCVKARLKFPTQGPSFSRVKENYSNLRWSKFNLACRLRVPHVQ